MSDDLPYHHIAQRFFNTPLFLQPAAAEVVGSVLLTRMGRGAGMENDSGRTTQAFAPTPAADGKSVEFHAPRASRFVGATPLDANGRPLPYRRTSEGAAIVTMIGELVNRGAWVGASSGLVSYEGFAFQMDQAARDPNTKAIVIDMQTPGGEAVGAFEAAAKVRAVREAKPVIALVNGLAASAGYMIASAASRIVSIPSGLAGSIGVVMVHLDYSKYLEKEGIKPTLIFSGAHKVDGNPFEPLPDSVRADFEARSRDWYDQFVQAVAQGRPQLTAQRIRDTEAQVFKGADAIAAGLVDSVGTFDDVLAEISGGSSGRTTTSTTMKGSTMDPKTEGAAAAVTASQITTVAGMQAAFPALCTDLMASAAKLERDRITGILGLPHKGHETLIAGLVADGKSSKADAALAMVEAERSTRERQSAAIAGVEAETGVVKPAAAAAGVDPKPEANTADAWKAEWAKTPALQAEFDSAELYAAFKEGESSGRIRILKTAKA
jgi:signal peptide peptidase SppA